MPSDQSQNLIFLTAEQLELIHAGVLAKSGGAYGTRNPGLLQSLETKPKQAFYGKVLYPSVLEKAAVYMHTIITMHPFVDGNKRTGMMATFTFLEVNGYRVTATDDAVFEYALFVATKKPEVSEIAAWLKKRTKKA